MENKEHKLIGKCVSGAQKINRGIIEQVDNNSSKESNLKLHKNQK